MRIIFMGSPDFALPALQCLLQSEHQIVGVYAKPPQPAGRGQHVTKSKVHILAEEAGLKVFTPASLKPAEEVAQFKELAADVAIVAAYGLLLRPEILATPRLGCINIHPSSLPRWRGAAPVQRTIMAGDKQTSVCIMRMDAGLDTGDIILQQIVELDEAITAKELHDQTADIGGKMVLQVLSALEDGTATFTLQATTGVTYAAKLMPADELLNWTQPARLVACQVRALSPKPGAYFNYNGEKVKIITAHYDENFAHNAPPGTVLDDKLTIACARGVLQPTLLQRQGRKMIYTDAFLRGFPILPGVSLA